jgi:menaquinone-dependent protoporphyrinogen oxidase
VSADRVLVAFSNQTGSTAAIAEVITGVLLREGLVVECRQARDVNDVSAYSAVILGSGVFVPSRRSDGGGFLTRHDAGLAAKPVWLFCVGPIGRGRCPTGEVTAPDECSVMTVARDVGARGAAVFGPIGLSADADPMDVGEPVDLAPVRTWATGIAADLTTGRTRARTRRSRVRGRDNVAVPG